MKKIAILLILATFVLALESYGGPKADAKKMIKIIEKYTDVVKKVADDKKIDDKEVEELKAMEEELDKFEEELDKKYKDDKKAEKIMKNFDEKNDKIYEEFFNAFLTLYECEGADKLF